MRIFIGGIGYRNLSDYSFGTVVVDALVARGYSSSPVTVEDISYNPIATIQRLRDEHGAPFDLAIVVGAAQRPQRKPGTLSVYRWDRALPAPEAIQAAITATLSGVIALNNILVIAEHFRILPSSVVVVEIEPGSDEFGDVLTPLVRAAVPRSSELIATLIADVSVASRIPEGRLDVNRPPALGFLSARRHDVVY